MKQCLCCRNAFQSPITLRSLLFPKQHSSLCAVCQEVFTLHNAPSCQYCGHTQTVDCLTCEHCSFWQQTPFKDKIVKTLACKMYEGASKKYYQQYKVLGDYVLQKWFSEMMKKRTEPYMKDFDLLVPIPSNESHYAHRPFHHVEALTYTIPLKRQRILQKTSAEKQSKRSKKERMQSTFFLERKEEHLQGERILLVDDLYTTGTTVHQAAFLLSEAGAKSVTVLTLFRSPVVINE